MDELEKTYKDRLFEWMEKNNMAFSRVDDEVISIDGFGEAYVLDTDSVKTAVSGGDELKLNFIADQAELKNEGINIAIFEFGDRFYYTAIGEPLKMTPLKYLGGATSMIGFDYTNLGIHSQFELLEGSNSHKAWCQKAKFLGHSHIGVCDKNTLAGALSLQTECDKAGIIPVFGYSTTLRYNDSDIGCKIYCQSKDSWGKMLRLQKKVCVDNYLDPHIGLNDLLELARGLVFVFEKDYATLTYTDLISSLKSHFDDVFYQIDLSEYKANRLDEEVLSQTKHYLKNLRNVIDPVLIRDTYYPDAVDHKTKVILNKIAFGTAHKQSEEQFYKTIREIQNEMSGLFENEKDFNDLLRLSCSNSNKIANNAEARIETGRIHAPQYEQDEDEILEFGGDNHKLFESIIEIGFRTLVPEGKDEQYRKQLNYEKYVIEATNNVDYFLIAYDEIRMVKGIGGQVGVGRGSAGGCIISYLMGIITIDPIEYGLIFERFLTPERCGLMPKKTTKVEKTEGTEFFEIETDEGVMRLSSDSSVAIDRGGDKITVLVSELIEDDKILLDRRDEIWEKKNILI